MSAVTGDALLAAWDRATGRPHPDRALVFCAVLGTSADPAELLDWPLGRRDAQVLELRRVTFGGTLQSMATCPGCARTVEFDLDIEAITGGSELLGGQSRVWLDGWVVELRPPTTADVLAVVGRQDPGRALMERCLVAAEHAGVAVPVERLPPEVGEVAVRRIAELDPLADISLDLTCADCGEAWQAPFDIVSFFGEELDAWAHATLAEVHTLARAYGWTEPEVLALSPVRRRHYLELARA